MNIHVRPPERQVVNAQQVAALLGFRSVTSFSTERRTRLEANGFPAKLPGLNGWSRPAIMRWLEANGETAMSTEPEHAGRPSALERRFG